MKWNGPAGARVIALLSAGAMVVTLGASARADTKASIDCRKTAGNELSKILNSQLKAIDKCIKSQHKADASTGACNVNGATFDPLGKYSAAVGKGTTKIDGKCLAGDPVLANYAPSGDPAADVIPQNQTDAFGNNLLVSGVADLGDPKDKANKPNVKCNETIGKGRTGIFKEVLKTATKCQAEIDKAATTFGPISPTCIQDPTKAATKATEKIGKDCNLAGVTADSAGCFPVPGCIISNSTLVAQSAARNIYSNQPVTAVCGDNVVEFPEQCDPPNGGSCTASCETVGPNCDAVAGSSIIGARTAKVTIGGLVGGQKLAGLQVNFDYPQFQAGIAGTGQSSIVQGKVTVLQGTPGTYTAIANDRDTDLTFVIGGTDTFIDNGDLLSIAMDACVAKEMNLCNRNQNVIGCCDSATDADLDGLFQECVNKCLGGGTKNNTTCTTLGQTPECLGTANGAICNPDTNTCDNAGDKTGQPCTVVGDCTTGNVQGTCTSGFANAPVSTSFPAATVGVGTPEDSCPGDNACFTQAEATGCTITDAVDNNGLPIDGVTCTVTLSGV